MKKIIIAAILLVLVGVGVWYFLSSGFVMSGTSISPKMVASSAAPSTYVVPAFEGEEYKNDKYRFSLALPEGFKPQELENDAGGQTVVLQDAEGNGIQIYITPYAEDVKVLTADDVRASISDMQVTEEQPVEIGADYKGVAFMSDNEAFGGASREVWFVFRGNLYQISTYARLDNLLQAMFGTWKFY